MTATELRAFRATHKLTRAQLAELLPVPLRTLERWEQGTHEPLPVLARALRDLERELKCKP